MRNLNDLNGASNTVLRYAKKTLEEFNESVIGVEMGIAYGGGVEAIGKLWGDKGLVYGFDTFEGHPKHVALIDESCDFSLDSHAAYCMDPHYANYGTEELSLEYQESALASLNIKNVKLIKGLIDDSTKIDFIPYINYCFLDLDFTLSMRHAYNLIKDKLVIGGYLCLHDVIPQGHIKGLFELYQEIFESGHFELEYQNTNEYLVVLKKIN